MAKEINELKNRVKRLQDLSQAQTAGIPRGIQLPPINKPLDVAESTGQRIGAISKNISMTKRKNAK